MYLIPVSSLEHIMRTLYSNNVELHKGYQVQVNVSVNKRQLSCGFHGHVTAEKGSCIHRGTEHFPPPSDLAVAPLCIIHFLCVAIVSQYVLSPFKRIVDFAQCTRTHPSQWTVAGTPGKDHHWSPNPNLMRHSTFLSHVAHSVYSHSWEIGVFVLTADCFNWKNYS